jgi:hypothetical protein
MLRGQALRPFYAPDTGGTGSGSPAADPVTDPAADPAKVTDPPAADPLVADPVPDPEPVPADPDVEAEEDADPELTAEEWQSEATKARKQAARYRTQLREAQARVAELEKQPAQPAADPAQAAEARVSAAERRALLAESAAEIGVASGMLTAIRELQAAETAEQISQALTKLHGFQAPASAGAHRPPAEQSTTLTLQQQIAAAEQSGDWKTSMRLKNQQLSQLAAQGTK